ncbi:unnamed protein product [Orchesella dallaii]|uniref:Uncharacterized protein n=1 Tax=Orchesella dallaii TaxID=48710 RepID=A0ABP1R3P3_9HEXA
MNTSRRQMIQHVVSLFAQEGGFHVIEKPVLETLTQMFKATWFEFGRSTVNVYVIDRSPRLYKNTSSQATYYRLRYLSREDVAAEEGFEEVTIEFFERTSSCYYLLSENESLFTLLLPKPATYLNPLIPQDQIFEEEQILAPLNYVKKEKPMEHVLNLYDDRDDDVLATTQFTTTTSWQFINNPFLIPTVLRMSPKDV